MRADFRRDFVMKAASILRATLPLKLTVMLLFVAWAVWAQDGFLPPVPSAYGYVLTRSDAKLYVFKGGSQTGPAYLVLYDPEKGSTRLADPPPIPANQIQDAVLVDDQTILVCDSACWVYSSGSNRWENRLSPGAGTDLIRLDDGRVLRAGGGTNRATYVLNPSSGQDVRAGDLRSSHLNGLLAKLSDGRVLLAGGWEPSPRPPFISPVRLAEIFDPATLQWSRVADGPEQFLDVAAALAPDGRIFIAGFTGLVAYDPGKGEWTKFGDVLLPQYSRLARLPNGLLLASGGTKTENPVADTWLIDPRTGAARTQAPLRLPREFSRVRVLPNGRVLVFCGRTSQTEATNTVEAFAWEPEAKLTLEPGFYVATASQIPQAVDGFWGLEMHSSDTLRGGLHFGGVLAGGGKEVGFGAFYLGDAQTVRGTVDLLPFPGNSETLEVTATILDVDKKPVSEPFRGIGTLTFSQALQPGFYVVELRSGAQAPPVSFQASVYANRLLGGGSAGGSLQQAAGVTGFLAFYLPTRQDITLSLYNENTFGRPRGVGEVVLSLYNSIGNVLHRSGPGGMSPATSPTDVVIPNARTR